MPIKVKKLLCEPMFFVGGGENRASAEKGTLSVFQRENCLIPIVPAVFVPKNQESALANQAVGEAIDRYFGAFSEDDKSFEARLKTASDFLNIRLVFECLGKSFEELTAPETYSVIAPETAVDLLAYIMSFADGEIAVRLDGGSIETTFKAVNECKFALSGMSDVCEELGIRIEYNPGDVCEVVIYPYKTDELMPSDLKNTNEVVYD